MEFMAEQLYYQAVREQLPNAGIIAMAMNNVICFHNINVKFQQNFVVIFLRQKRFALGIYDSIYRMLSCIRCYLSIGELHKHLISSLTSVAHSSNCDALNYKERVTGPALQTQLKTTFFRPWPI